LKNISFHSMDWNFLNQGTNKGIHTIHPYPAKFIPQIPRQLLELFYTGDSSVVLDPFCGSGTTLVEAINMGIDAYGIDLNPIACLLSRVKTTPLPYGLSSIASKIVDTAKELLQNEPIEVPYIPNLDHWFEPNIQKALTVITDQINSVSELSLKEALQIALSSIIVRVSNQESDTRYAAVNKEISVENVFNLFIKATTFIDKEISLFFNNISQTPGHATIINKDILTVTEKDLPKNIGLVITSPPYPNAYEYWLYHKYRMYWLGMDPIAVRQKEIGARPNYFKTNPQDEHDFEKQMKTCFYLLSKVMKPSAKACFLVGRSIIHKKKIDNVLLLQRAAKPSGFVIEDIVERTIPKNRKAFAHGHINKEHILIFTLKEKP